MVKMVHFMLCIFDHSKINQTSLSIAKSPDSVTSLDTLCPLSSKPFPWCSFCLESVTLPTFFQPFPDNPKKNRFLSPCGSSVLCSLELTAFLQEKLWETHAGVFLKRGWIDVSEGEQSAWQSRCLIPTELIYGRVRFEMASDPSKGTLWLDHLQPLLKESERQGRSTAELGVARITSTEVAGRGQKLHISSQGWNWGQVSRVGWRPNNLELSYWRQNSGWQGLRKKEDVEEKAQTRMTVTGWTGLDRHSVWCLPRSWDKAFLASVNLQCFIEPPFSLPSCSSWN